MTENEAIKKIKLRIAGARHVVGAGIDGKAFEDLEMAIKALEKQIPKKLDEHNFYDEPHHYLCPDCGNIVINQHNYCEECGQKLDWND